jgi:hypothetical protein
MIIKMIIAVSEKKEPAEASEDLQTLLQQF